MDNAHRVLEQHKTCKPNCSILPYTISAGGEGTHKALHAAPILLLTDKSNLHHGEIEIKTIPSKVAAGELGICRSEKIRYIITNVSLKFYCL